MSEFKFACPVCGQHITTDSGSSGKSIECPTCFRKIVVPQAPASEETKLILSAAQAALLLDVVPAEAAFGLAFDFVQSTVFPTPRSPMIAMLKYRDLGPARRPPSIVASVASRPANQGGSAPKVGL